MCSSSQAALRSNLGVALAHQQHACCQPGRIALRAERLGTKAQQKRVCKLPKQGIAVHAERHVGKLACTLGQWISVGVQQCSLVVACDKVKPKHWACKRNLGLMQGCNQANGPVLLLVALDNKGNGAVGMQPAGLGVQAPGHGNGLQRSAPAGLPTQSAHLELVEAGLVAGALIG